MSITPDSSGLYLGRYHGSTWDRVLIYLIGEAPFLVILWAFDMEPEDMLVDLDPDHFEFTKKIQLADAS